MAVPKHSFEASNNSSDALQRFANGRIKRQHISARETGRGNTRLFSVYTSGTGAFGEVHAFKNITSSGRGSK